MRAIFTQLDQQLQDNEHLWRFEPFQASLHKNSPWSDVNPELYDWLLALSIDQIQFYKTSITALLTDIAPVLSCVRELKPLMTLPKVNLEGAITLQRGLDKGIPGRKFEQILSMSRFALLNHKGSQWLEWCSGKGYLGRILTSQSKQNVTSLEWQDSLCCSGQKEADEQSLPMTFVQGDALSQDAKRLFKHDQHAVALHACGDLHVQLLKNASTTGCKAISISPCCYHLIEKDNYQPLSKWGVLSTLNLNKAELRIPLQETVTGGKRVSKHREDEMRYRLGFDLLLRSVLGFQEYVSIPSIKKSELASGFEHFCYWAAQKKQISLQSLHFSEADFQYWEEQGRKRFWQMERLSLVQQLFRRPLELWLVFDKALYLQEQGYEVSVSEFCRREMTPRNIIIHGELR